MGHPTKLTNLSGHAHFPGQEVAKLNNAVAVTGAAARHAGPIAAASNVVSKGLPIVFAAISLKSTWSSWHDRMSQLS